MIELRLDNVTRYTDSEDKATKLESLGYERVNDSADEVIVKTEKVAEIDDMTVKELRYFSVHHGIRLKSKKKADMLAEIKEALND